MRELGNLVFPAISRVVGSSHLVKIILMPLVHVLIGFLTFFFYFSRSSSNEINRNRAAPGHAPQNIWKVKRAPVKPPPLVCDPNDKPDLSLIPEQKTLCYQTYDDISNRRIIGRWEDNAVFSTPGIFSYTNNVADCPIFSGYSCRFHDHGNSVARKRYNVLNCELPEFVPQKFLEMLKNRRILFSGDSTFMQLFVMIACSMYKQVPFTYNISRHHQYDYLIAGELTFSSTNTTILFQNYHAFTENQTYYDSYNLSDFISYGKLFSSNDLLFLNFGHHFHYESIQKEVTEKIAQEYSFYKEHEQQHQHSTIPILIWAETTAEHFTTNPSHDKVPTGYFLNWQKTSCSCYENILLTKQQDYRNNLAEYAMKHQYSSSPSPSSHDHSIPILRIWNVTSNAWNQHVGLHFQRNVYDCLHFCEQSGVYYYYRDLLYNILPPLLLHRQGNTMKG